MIIENIIKKSTAKLAESSTTARVDSELLLAQALNQTRSYLYTHPEKVVTANQSAKFLHQLKRRLEGEPIAYLLGRREFWTLELLVNHHVLIPRPETELLVEITLQLLGNEPKLIAELGTGSGAIALALASERSSWSIIATDYSENALKVARTNRKFTKLHNVKFRHGNWCTALPNQKFHAIISNPPYIATNDLHLTQGDLRFEPKSALISGSDGLDAIRIIISEAPSKLGRGGWLILEHGFDQAEAVADLMRKHGFSEITNYRDFANHPRVTIGRTYK